MKILMTVVILFISIIAAIQPAIAADLTPMNTAVVDTIDLKNLNSFLNTLDLETKNLLPRLDLQSWGVTGPKWDFAKIGKGIMAYFLRELVFNFKLLGELLLLAMALAILQNMQHAFENETVSQIAFSLCFLVVMGLVINSFRVTFLVAREALAEMTNFMYADYSVAIFLDCRWRWSSYDGYRSPDPDFEHRVDGRPDE